MPTRPPKPADRKAQPRHRKGAANEQPQKRTIQRLIRERPSPDDFARLDREVQQVHSRSAAILLASEVELYLELAILTKLPNNDADIVKILVGRDGPLGGFFAKIHLAFAMGLITADQCHDLNIIRTVRNAFAHAPRPIEFSTEEIRTEIGNLRCIKNFKLPPLPDLAVTLAGMSNDPIRRKFIAAGREIGLALLKTIPPRRS